jgi:hypothetical protein
LLLLRAAFAFDNLAHDDLGTPDHSIMLHSDRPSRLPRCASRLT